LDDPKNAIEDDTHASAVKAEQSICDDDFKLSNGETSIYIGFD